MKFVLRNLSSLPGHSPDPHTGGVTLEGIQTAGVGAIIHVLNSTMLNEKKGRPKSIPVRQTYHPNSPHSEFRNIPVLFNYTFESWNTLSIISVGK